MEHSARNREAGCVPGKGKTGMARRGLLLGSSALLTLIPVRLFAGGLKADETVLFLPTYARRTGDSVEVNISAWVFEFERRPGARTAFLKLLDVDLTSPEAEAIFAARSRWFLTDSERGKELTVTFEDGSTATLPATSRAGRSETSLRMSAPSAPAIRFHTRRNGDDGEIFTGIAHIVGETGLSVVSDIDDTIKISNVVDTRALLRDSLIKPFAAAPGMAALYRDLAQKSGTSFHYLSSSPIQLLPALSGFLEAEGFPPGSMHLRESTAWNSLIPASGGNAPHKSAMLARLLADFPQRSFLLIGDSGEQDPEIYGEAARAHPGRDIRILIRRAGGSPATEARFASAFDSIDPARWRVLPEGEAVPPHLPF